MRTIKFRAWDKEERTSRMIYLTPKFLKERQGNLQDFLYSDRFIPMQFTGLKDKNGKEIYEGDIVSVYVLCEGDNRQSVIKFGNREDILLSPDDSYDGTALITGFYLEGIKDIGDIDLDGCIIIGNIYENKDLLTKIKK